MDKKWMEYCLELAEKGRGYTSPNPIVGAVIVKDGEIMGKGWHKCFGGPHAEINAINDACQDVTGATMYVTLEPCSHYGKTPPCVLEIIRHKLAKVVIGMIDPNPLVSGRGVAVLADNGIPVITGVMEEDCRKVNEVYIKFITTGLPFVVMKTAMTLDGKIATYTGDSKWVTDQDSRNLVHRLRHGLSGIMVGVETVINDNPMLTARITGAKNPIRIIGDSRCRTPLDANVLSTENGRCIIAATEKAPRERIEALMDRGAEIIFVKSREGHVDLKDLMIKLGEQNVDSVLLEGGGEINFSALDQGVVDKVVAFISPKFVGGREAKTPVEGPGISQMSKGISLTDIKVTGIGNDFMIEGYINKEEDKCLQA